MVKASYGNDERQRGEVGIATLDGGKYLASFHAFYNPKA